MTGIHFDNFSIRPLRVSDEEPYFTMVDKNRKRLENFFTGTVSRTGTIEDTRIFLKEIAEKVTARSYFPFLIINNSSKEVIGFLDIKNIDWNIPKAELGCYVDEHFADKGITSKAFALFCDFCFEEYRFKKLFLRTHESNHAAIRVAEKCGFELEGKIRWEYKTTAGELVDLLYYGRIV